MAAEQRTSTNLARIPQWSIGDRLRKSREASGLGVEELAGLIGRTRNSITRYERSHTVDILVVRAYADFTRTSLEWLLTGIAPTDPNGEGVPANVTLWELSGNSSRELDQIKPRSLLKLVA